MPRISVIIPAYNAARTINDTLLSVRNQSFRNIEIIVVDDGSTDATAAIISRHVEQDDRVRLVSVENGGVAYARNVGIACAEADLIAPVDSDDLWHPCKLELQEKLFDTSAAQTGLVYCWFKFIDSQDRIIGEGPRDRSRGNVLRRMCLGNLIGNGSSPLMKKTAVLEAGGYDSGLREQGAQGCEDLKLYFSIAERYEFEVVPFDLVGYRETSENMSSDGFRMLRSYDLVMDPAQLRYPAYEAEFREGRIHLTKWLLERAIKSGSAEQAWRMGAELYRQAPAFTLRMLPNASKILRRRFISRPSKNLFSELPDFDPRSIH